MNDREVDITIEEIREEHGILLGRFLMEKFERRVEYGTEDFKINQRNQENINNQLGELLQQR